MNKGITGMLKISNLTSFEITPVSHLSLSLRGVISFFSPLGNLFHQ